MTSQPQKSEADELGVGAATCARQVDDIVNRAALQIWQSVADPSRQGKDNDQRAAPHTPSTNATHIPPVVLDTVQSATAPPSPSPSLAIPSDSSTPTGKGTWFTSSGLVVWVVNQWQRLAPYVKPVLRWLGIAFALWFVAVLVLIALYRFVNPPLSNTMLFQRLGGQTIQHRWVPLTKVSTQLIKAVVVAEDAKFCQHWGIDVDAMQYAIEHAGDGTPRGASTISMQTAKNLFLWSSKSYVRKILEVPVTLAMEVMWPKRRLLEIYLNIAEWGPGVFGIGAAAQHHFGARPSELGPGASALLAAALPNPIVRKAGRPGPKTRAKARVVQARARTGGQYIGCIGR